MKKVLFMAVLFAAAFSSLSASARDWMDNYGKIWHLQNVPCAENQLGSCVAGTRDAENVMGCGALPVYGTVVQTQQNVALLTLTVFPGPTGTCVATTWIANYSAQADSWSGNTIDQTGAQQTFTFGLHTNPTERYAHDPSLGHIHN